MATARIPVIDLGDWYPNDSAARNHLAARVDQALKATGFLLVTGHGITPDLVGQVRAAAYEFFHLSSAVKERYAQDAGRRGWIGRERFATARSEGSHTPPDLLEVWSCGSGSITHAGRTQQLPRSWPDEVPSLQPLVTEYSRQIRGLPPWKTFGHAMGTPWEH